jgi:pimeloyl-ACP methyl ester carboxylesterase
MVHGSGSQDRYEFQPLAEYFASFGVAVLAYDKRGAGSSSGHWQTATYRELAEDALAGLHYLQSRSAINPKQIGMWGLSQGGWLTALAASLSKDVAFIIPVSGPGVNPAQQEIWRVEHMLRADGFLPAEIEAAVALKRRGFSLSQHGETDWNEFVIALEQAKDEAWFAYLGFEATPQKEDILRDVTLVLEPVPILQQVTCPVLAIFGELDPYLPVQQSAANVEQALKAGGNPDHTLTIIPKGNHVIFEAVTGGTHEQSSLPGYVPEYLSTLREWLLKRVTVIG